MTSKVVPQGRMSRLLRLATVGARAGAGALFGAKGAAEHTAEVLGNLRGLASKVGQMVRIPLIVTAQIAAS